jgi:hypothetical protein
MAALIVTPFAVAAVVLFPSLLRRKSEFRLVVRANRVTFTIGETQSRGIFNSIPLAGLSVAGPAHAIVHDLRAIESATAPADLTSRTTVEIARIIAPKGDALTFSGVRLHTLPLRQGRQITLLWDESEPRRVNLMLAGKPSIDDTTLIEMKQSVPVACDNCMLEISGHGVPLGTPATLTFASRRLAEVKAIDDADVGLSLWVDGNQKLSDGDIALEDGSSVDFTQLDDKLLTSSITGNNNSLSFPELERSLPPIKDGDFAMLAGLSDAIIRRVVVDDGISLVITGRIGSGLRTGTTLTSLAPATPTWAEFLVFGRGWSAYCGLVGMVGTAILSILTRLKIVAKG